MDDTVLPPKLLKDLSHAADIVRGHEFIQIFSHYDADGISAAAIIAKALMRAGKEFDVRLFTTLNDRSMEVIRGCGSKCIILSDLGASYVEELDAMSCDVVVLDHHAAPGRAKRICYANPHLYGIDGMTSGCGATMALLFAVQLDAGNWDLVQLAFAGIAGDRQHINGMSGLNTHLLAEGTKRKMVSVADGSLIPYGDIASSLLRSTDPYIRGVSGNPDGVAKIMEDAGIARGRHYKDLSDDERRKLSSLIAVKLTEQKVCQQTLYEVARTRYVLTDWDMDAEALASLLNSCGRLGLMGVGVGAGMGDPESLKMARELEIESGKQIVEGAVALDKKGLTQMENIQWFDSSSSGFTGIICGIAMQFFGDPAKPTIGINTSEDLAKISSRGMWSQLDKGVDLSVALRESCESVGGSGGGHRIASGGSVDASRRDEFLRNLDSAVGRQLGRAR